MARKKDRLKVDLEVVYVPMPENHVAAWRAGVTLLLKFIRGQQVLRVPGEEFDSLSSDQDLGDLKHE
ncbi:MAG TPA: hypothetical protein VJ785_11225 [Anaerolineales bacterium]|nr:hypothetical protein [Anaerolineales bacterium]